MTIIVRFPPGSPNEFQIQERSENYRQNEDGTLTLMLPECFVCFAPTDPFELELLIQEQADGGNTLISEYVDSQSN